MGELKPNYKAYMKIYFKDYLKSYPAPPTALPASHCPPAVDILQPLSPFPALGKVGFLVYE